MRRASASCAVARLRRYAALEAEATSSRSRFTWTASTRLLATARASGGAASVTTTSVEAGAARATGAAAARTAAARTASRRTGPGLRDGMVAADRGYTVSAARMWRNW